MSERTLYAGPVALAFLLVSPAAQADTVPLDTVTVTATGSASGRPELAPDAARNPFRTPRSSEAHTQTIDREEIERLRPLDIFELLNNASGVISTQGSRKGFSGLRVRGDANFRFIIDGALLQPTMASRMLRALPVSIIEEVKIVRGGSALTLAPMVGSASPGGAPVDGFIVIRTRKPVAREAEVRTAVESYGTVQSNIWAGTTIEADGVAGYVSGTVAYGTTDGPGSPLDNGAPYNAGRETVSGMAKTGFEAHGWLVDLMAYVDDGSFEIPNAGSHGTGQGSWFMDPSRSKIFVASGSKGWDEINTTLFSLSRSENRQKFWTANTAAGPYAFVRNDNQVTHLNLRHNIDVEATRVMVGGDWMHWEAPNGQQYYEGIPREEETLGWFAQVEQGLFEDRLTLDASYRQDQVDVLQGLDYYIGGAQPPGGVNSPLRTTDKTLPIARFLSFGASFEVMEDWRLTARFGTAKQASDGLNSRPGVTLGDDEQQKWEVGVEGRLASWFNPALNFFERQVENEKLVYGYSYLATNGSSQVCRPGVVPAAGPLSAQLAASILPCYDQANTTRGGFELSVGGRFAARSSYRASLTHFTRFENAGSITPRDTAELVMAHGIGPVTLSGAVKYVASYKSAATDADAWLGGYTRYDAGIAYDFALGATEAQATLYGRNLTDETYETTNGIQDVGRVVGVEMIARF